MLGRGKFQRLYIFAGFALSLGACAVDVDPHAGHGAHGQATGTPCRVDSQLTYASFGASFLERYCVDCHASTLLPAERSGAPFGTDYDTRESLIASGLTHVDYVAAAGPAHDNDFMPPRSFGSQPTLEERLALGEWLACGAP